MKEAAFDDLARLPVIQYYEAAFRKATGVSLKVVSPDVAASSLRFGPSDNPFCSLVASTPQGCAACAETEARARRSAAIKRSPQQLHCYAGLPVMADPKNTRLNSSHLGISYAVF